VAGKQDKQKRSKKIFWWIGATLSVFIIIPLIVLVYAIDSYALVASTASVDADSAGKAKMVAKQLLNDLNNPAASTQHTRLTLSENEINGIIALGTRGIKGLKGRVNVTSLGINGAFSFKLPSNPFGSYINLSGIIIPSQTGLLVHDVTIGSIELPGALLVSVTETLLNRLLSGEKTGTRLINSIASITVKNSQLTIVYQVIPNLKKILDDTRAEVKTIRNDLALLGSPKVVKFYYQTLCDFHRQVVGIDNDKVSLGFYLSRIFSVAQKRQHILEENPVEENKAALLALAIFLGSANFDSVIGAIDNKTFKSCQPYGNHTVLANRNDLRLHFIYSAALKIISDSGLSFAIGEFKELLDSQAGGSGFSFADLAADRAGIRFVELALDKTGALHVQKMATQLTREGMFFPSISALPENISQQQFEQRGGIESDYYAKYLAIINHRINNLALYKTQ